MQKESIQITVLEDFDGCTAKVLETITRKTTKSGHRDRKGRPQQQRTYVSYKGKKVGVFLLSPNYGFPGYTNCISVEKVWKV